MTTRAAVPRAQAAATLATAPIPAILAALRAPVRAGGTAVPTRAHPSAESAVMAATIVIRASIAVSGMARRSAALRLDVRESLILEVPEEVRLLALP